MDRKQIEESIKTKILSVYTVLPISLFGGTFWLVDYLDPSEQICRKFTPMLSAILASSLSIIVLLLTYTLATRKEIIDKTDFSGFVHDSENSYWINRTTEFKICETCKTMGKLTPLSKFGNGWKCPLHENVVGKPKNIAMPSMESRSPWSL